MTPTMGLVMSCSKESGSEAAASTNVANTIIFTAMFAVVVKTALRTASVLQWFLYE